MENYLSESQKFRPTVYIYKQVYEFTKHLKLNLNAFFSQKDSD